MATTRNHNQIRITSAIFKEDELEFEFNGESIPSGCFVSLEFTRDGVPIEKCEPIRLLTIQDTIDLRDWLNEMLRSE